MNITETEPDVGTVWATPLGASLLEHDPTWQPTLKCPAADKSGVPTLPCLTPPQNSRASPISTSARKRQARRPTTLATQNPKAKLADVANALILAYCQGAERALRAEPAQKTAAMTRYGEVVIEALRAKAAAQPGRAGSEVTFPSARQSACFGRDGGVDRPELLELA